MGSTVKKVSPAIGGYLHGGYLPGRDTLKRKRQGIPILKQGSAA